MPAPNDTKNIYNNDKEDALEQGVREITQTDHINKKLLTSLFKRMDETGDSPLAKMLNSNNQSDENNEWND